MHNERWIGIIDKKTTMNDGVVKTSNTTSVNKSYFCTSQALLANVSAAYAIYHGPKGINQIAERISKLAKSFADKIKKSGYELYSNSFFDTVTILTKDKTQNIYKNDQPCIKIYSYKRDICY